MAGHGSETSSTALSTAIIEMIAEREGIDPTVLQDPLHAVIDPEALDSLFRSENGWVTFAYHGYDVTVSSERCIDLQRSDEC